MNKNNSKHNNTENFNPTPKQKFSLPKPWLYNNKWLVWPGTVFNSLEISQCDDTINGICLTNKTIEECINECTGDCEAGYHISFENGETICLPLKTNISTSYINPIYLLTSQYNIPELNAVHISSYVNRDKFSFPPDLANTLFYNDILTIKSDDMYISNKGKTPIENNDILYMSPNKYSQEINIQLLQTIEARPQISNYIPIKYGDFVSLSIPVTSLVGRVNRKTDFIEWISDKGSFYSEKDVDFKIMPVDGSGNKIGDNVIYGDKIIFEYGGSGFVTINKKDKYLQIENIPASKASVFTFESKMNGYYCENNSCKSIEMNKTTPSTEKRGGARYNGKIIGRNKDCWGMCSYMIPNTNNEIYPFMTTGPPYLNNEKYIYIILVMITCIIGFIIYVKYKYIKTHK